MICSRVHLNAISDKDREPNRLSTHSAEAVDTRREPLGNIDREYAIYSGGIDALEERKQGRIQQIGRVDRTELLDGQMRMTNDILALQLLGSAVVI